MQAALAVVCNGIATDEARGLKRKAIAKERDHKWELRVIMARAKCALEMSLRDDALDEALQYVYQHRFEIRELGQPRLGMLVEVHEQEIAERNTDIERHVGRVVKIVTGHVTRDATRESVFQRRYIVVELRDCTVHFDITWSRCCTCTGVYKR